MMNRMNIHPKILTLLADVPVSQPSLPENIPNYEGAFLKMILTLLVLVVGIIGTIWFMRRLAGGRFGSTGGRSIKVLEKKPLSPKTMLYVIEVQGKQAVISESQLEVKTLMSLPERSEEIEEQS